MKTAKSNFLLFFVFCAIFACSDDQLLINPSDTGQSSFAGSFTKTNCITTFEGTQPGGAFYKIIFPDTWNHELVIYAHGYVAENEPLTIPQLMVDDTTSLSEFFTNMNYAFATTSYRKNGLAIKEGIEDLSELLAVSKNTIGRISNVYLIGFAEGGLVTALSMEKNFFMYNGALVISSPSGDFSEEINYIGNFRVLFDYYFPGIIPGSVIDVPQDVSDNFDEVYVPAILKAVKCKSWLMEKIMREANVPYKNHHSKEYSKHIFIDILRYHAITTKNMQTFLGGQPFDNYETDYEYKKDNKYYDPKSQKWGTDSDFLNEKVNDIKISRYEPKDKYCQEYEHLNDKIPRYQADQAALDEINNYYQTSGRLFKPMVMLHAKHDPLIPVKQLKLYKKKAETEGSNDFLVTDVFRYHKKYPIKAKKLKVAFDTLVLKVTGKLPGMEAEIIL